MADEDETASAAEPSAADAWFERKMALHETSRRASAKARQTGAVAEQKRLERTEEAARRVDRELEWNRARVSALRARLETAIAPRRAARDARDPAARHKAAPKPVFVSYARDAPFAERALVRAIVDAVNELPTTPPSRRSRSSSTTCWHDDDDVPVSESRDWRHVQLRRVDAARACDVFVVVGSPSYERSSACALERAALNVRRAPPEWGGDGREDVVVVAVDAAEACGLDAASSGSAAASSAGLDAPSWGACVREGTRDVVVSANVEETEPRMRKRTRAFEDAVARRVAAAVRETLFRDRVVSPRGARDGGARDGEPFDVSPSALAEATEALRATSRTAARRVFADAEQKYLVSKKLDDANADPPDRWSVRRVAEWLRSLGGWTAPFVVAFEAERTHGSILDALDFETARERFGATDARVARKLLEACSARFAGAAKVASRKDADRRDDATEEEIERVRCRLDDARGDDNDESDDDDDDGVGFDSSASETSLSSRVSRAALARLRDALATRLRAKSRDAPVVSEDAAFDALRETAAAFFLRAHPVSRGDDAKDEKKKKGVDDSADASVRSVRDACLLACCDAFETRSESVAGRVDAARFAAAAAATLHGELDGAAAMRRRRATAELEALEALEAKSFASSSSAPSPGFFSDARQRSDHVTPLLLRAALETKLRERGVRVGDGARSDVSDASAFANAKRAVDDVIADGLLAGAGAAGARAAARMFQTRCALFPGVCPREPEASRREMDACVTEMVRVAFARRTKTRVDAAVSAAEARAAATRSARAAVRRRRDAFETARASDARSAALCAYESRLRAALAELASVTSSIEAYRGAVRLVETFAATRALADGAIEPSSGSTAGTTDTNVSKPNRPCVHAGVLVPGARGSRSRALRIVHASSRSSRKTGSEIRAWEGNAWPSVGEVRLAGPLDDANGAEGENDRLGGEEKNERASFPSRVVDGDDELVVPVFAFSAARGTGREDATEAEVSDGDDESFDSFAREHVSFGSLDDDRSGPVLDDAAENAAGGTFRPDASETPLGFLALETLETGRGAAEHLAAPAPEAFLARKRRAVVLLAARAASVALTRFARARRADREALRRAAREAFAADDAAREARRVGALEALEEKRGDATASA